MEYLRGPGSMWVGRNNPTIDPIYVSDVVDCAVAAAESEAAIGQAYNVAPDCELGVREFWNTLCRELAIRPPLWTIPVWIVSAAAIVCETLARLIGRRQPPTLTRAGVALFATDRHHDPSKAIRELAWRPKVQLAEGVRRTVRALSPEICAETASARLAAQPAPLGA
jgi:nucleoside-diphosphate-sugar epimerase